MAKSQKHGNREAKKPKKVKIAPAVESRGVIAKTGVLPGTSKRQG